MSRTVEPGMCDARHYVSLPIEQLKFGDWRRVTSNDFSGIRPGHDTGTDADTKKDTNTDTDTCWTSHGARVRYFIQQDMLPDPQGVPRPSSILITALARLTNRYPLRPDLKSLTDCHKKPGIRCPRLYVGIDGVSLRPVYFDRTIWAWKYTCPDYGPSFHGFKLRPEPRPKAISYPSTLLLHFKFTREAGSMGPSFLQWTRSLAFDPVLGVSEQELEQWHRRPKYSFEYGHTIMPFEPTTGPYAAPDAFGGYSLGAIAGMGPKLEEFYTLRLPNLSAASIPSALCAAIAKYVRSLKHDLLSTNLAILAALLWARIDADDTLEIEPRFRQNDERDDEQDDGQVSRGVAVPSVKLEVFMHYFGHYLRFHEIYQLASYGHPFRFIDTAYHQDVQHDAIFRIRRHKNFEADVRRLCSQVTFQPNPHASTYPDESVPTLPCLMPGSTQPLLHYAPDDHGVAITRDMVRMGTLIADIHQIGHPSYPVAAGNHRPPALKRRLWVHESLLEPGAAMLACHREEDRGLLSASVNSPSCEGCEGSHEGPASSCEPVAIAELNILAPQLTTPAPFPALDRAG